MRRSSRWLFGLLLAAGAVVIGVMLTRAAREAAVFALVTAPNLGRPAPRRPPAFVDEAFRVEVSDGVVVEAWRLEPAIPAPSTAPTRTVVLLHGIRDRKESFLGRAQALRTRGLRVILMDARGHGGSSGKSMGYGAREGADVSAVLDHVAATRSLGDVGLVGASYGGAIALAAAARDTRVVRVATLATFSDLKNVVADYGARYAFVRPPEWFVDEVLAAATARTGIPYASVDSRRAIAATHAEVLLQHGTEDGQIPKEHAARLFAACEPGRCRLVMHEGRTHDGLLGDDEAWAAVEDFLTTRERASGPSLPP